jgi:peptide/nickel transport system substrate-binding protein
MYNSALVMQQELQAIGINAQMKVVDWPTSVQLSQKPDSGWNFFFTGWGTQPALGPLAVMQFLADPNATYRPPNDKGDPEVMRLWNAMNDQPTPEERQKAFADMQKYVLEHVYALPFGSFTKVQGVRSNVKGFVPFRIPRMSNVWFAD